jgi:hypothetical protein
VTDPVKNFDLRQYISRNKLDVILVLAENRLRVEKQPAGKMIGRSGESLVGQHGAPAYDHPEDGGRDRA